MTDITGILEAVIALIGVIITCVIIPYLKTKTTAMQREKAQAWIDIGVNAAEQIFKTTGVGKKKKEYVINFLKSKGITYDEATIDALIEASVKALNIAQGDVKVIEIAEYENDDSIGLTDWVRQN